MKIFHQPEPNNNERRVVTKFLWFPKTCECETRWLETATYIEQYTYGGSYDESRYYWKIIEWVSVEEND